MARTFTRAERIRNRIENLQEDMRYNELSMSTLAEELQVIKQLAQLIMDQEDKTHPLMKRRKEKNV